MNELDLNKIEKIISDRETGREKLLKYSPEVFKSFVELNKTAFKDGTLLKLHKELIALGISIVTNCEPCIQNHIRKAFESGASEQQIIETIEVSIEMGGGPATVASRFALKVLEYYQNKK
ncbi:MAG: carboxymuconolactone decarboxylase family protein [Candidatus Hermodarchaeota archaeon]